MSKAAPSLAPLPATPTVYSSSAFDIHAHPHTTYTSKRLLTRFRHAVLASTLLHSTLAALFISAPRLIHTHTVSF